MKTYYTCAECGKSVSVKEGEPPRRSCQHENAGIIAHCSATLTGKSKVA